MLNIHKYFNNSARVDKLPNSVAVASEASFHAGTPEMESFLQVLQRSGALRRLHSDRIGMIGVWRCDLLLLDPRIRGEWYDLVGHVCRPQHCSSCRWDIDEEYVFHKQVIGRGSSSITRRG